MGHNQAKPRHRLIKIPTSPRPPPIVSGHHLSVPPGILSVHTNNSIYTTSLKMHRRAAVASYNGLLARASGSISGDSREYTTNITLCTHLIETKIMAKMRYLPSNGTTSDVGGMISTTSKKNTCRLIKIDIESVTCLLGIARKRDKHNDNIVCSNKHHGRN